MMAAFEDLRVAMYDSYRLGFSWGIPGLYDGPKRRRRAPQQFKLLDLTASLAYA